MENDDTPQQHGSYACHTFSSNTRTFEWVRHSLIGHVHVCTDSGGGHFEHLLVICDFINNKNSTVIKLGMCTVNVLRQL